jgi:signal transduction histidine kinase
VGEGQGEGVYTAGAGAQGEGVPGGRRSAVATRPRFGLGLKLFLSYLVVVAVAVAAVLLAADLVAPRFFASHMMQFMGPGGTGGMGAMMGPGRGPAARAEVLDTALEAAYRASVSEALLVGGVVGVAAALLISLFVTRRLVGPVRRLAHASRQIAAGEYDQRVAAESGDELGELAASFNEMAGALAATERRRLELIADVAHELRTPVAVLEGYLEGLLDGVVPPTDATWARLHDEAGRMRRLVDDLQELSRAEAGQIPMNLAPADPAEIVRVAVDRLAAQFQEKGLALEVDAPQALPRVLADTDRAVQVLTSLLGNALRYTPAPGAVRVSAAGQADAVEFKVIDTGVGIPPEHLPHVFERFYRVDKSRARELGGSGIGLTIARALVEAMGGRTQAASPGPGQGATFWFTLPRLP